MKSFGLGSSRWNKSRRSDGCDGFEDRWRIKAYGCGCGGFEDFGSLVEFSFGSLGFKSRIVVILCLDYWVVAEDGLMGLCLFSCWFLGMCFFLCLVDKKDLLPGLCLCYCWRPVCVFVFGWQDRSTAGFVFVFLLEIGLCVCVWLTRKGKKILENLGMCSYI